MRKTRRYQWGYSLLLELLLGLGLVLIVLLAIFQLFPVGDRSVGLADRTTHAHLLARRVMNEQLEVDYADLADTTGEETLSAHTHRRGQDLSTTYVYDVKIEPVTGVEVKNIVVTVRWKSGSQDQERDAFVRLESARGLLW